MTDIGSQLRAAREAQGLSVEQAFKATRIKAIYLEAIEANRVSALPGPVQARGFVRSYANFLGLDGETLASALDAMGAPVPLPMSPTPKPIAPVAVKPLATAPDRSMPRPARPIERPALPKIALSGGQRDTASASPGGVPTSLLIIGAIVLFAVGAVLIVSALSSSPRPMPTPDSNGPLSVDQQLAAGPVSITLTAREHVWLRVTLDGQPAFEGLMQPADVGAWLAADQVLVETGNGAALQVSARTRSGVLGERGQIVARAWTNRGAEDVPLASAHSGPPAPTFTLATSTLRP